MIIWIDRIDPLAGVSGLNTGLPTANSGTDILQRAAQSLLAGSQQQSVSFQPAQLLQVRQALAQQQAAQVAANQAALMKRIETEAQNRAEELVKVAKEKLCESHP